MLIGLSGKAGSGKDAAFRIIQALTDYAFDNKKNSYKLKQIAGTLLGDHNFAEKWELSDREFRDFFLEDWGMTRREFLMKLGTEAIRDGLNKNSWILALYADYRPLISNWIVTDVRFKNEAEALKERGGILIRIERPGTKGQDHPSDKDLDDYQGFDKVIVNDGTLLQFQEKIHQYVFESEILNQIKP